MNAAVGRKDPQDPKLREAQLIYQMGLKKDWANNCSYWVELYCREIGPANRAKVKVFYIYRQWSFWKSTSKEVIDGNVISEAISSLPAAEQHLVDFIRMRIEEKGDTVEYTKEHEDWTGIAHRIALELDQREKVVAAMMRTKIKDRDKTLAEKFKETQREREKKADW